MTETLLLLLRAAIAASDMSADAVEQPKHTRIQAEWVIRPSEDIALGGVAGSAATLKPNLAVVLSVCPSPDDLLRATLYLTVTAPAGNAAATLAEGKAAHGRIVRLSDCAALQSVDLPSGSRLAFAVWRRQWHYWGGGELRDFQVERIADGKTAALPLFTDQPAVQTELGTFRLAGCSRRDKFPLLDKEAEVSRGDKNGSWQVKSGKGVGLESAEKTLRFNTNGRADWSATHDWAPVLVFEPESPGLYRLRGELKISSGQAADEKQPETVSWMAMLIGGNQQPAEANLCVYPVSNGKTMGVRPAASISLGNLQPGQKQSFEVQGLEKLPASWWTQRAPEPGLRVTVEPRQGASGFPPRLSLSAKELKCELDVRSHPRHRLFANPLKPSDGVYAQVKNGKLTCGGQRLRLWGVAGGVGPAGHDDLAAARAADRLARLGFNAIRLWGVGGQEGKGSPVYDAASAARGEFRDPSSFKPDDRNHLDEYDRYFAACRKAGLFVMCPHLMSGIGREYLARDGSFVSGGADWEEWKAAILAGNVKANRVWMAFDERLIKAQRKHAANFLNHVNPYTGKRYADEEAVAVWEIHNEHRLIHQALDAGFDAWPAYFRDKLGSLWNAWLKARYGSDKKLTEAWGKLDNGESLARGAFRPAPVFSQRTAHPEARGDDFVAFVTGLVAGYYRDYEAFCRAQGKPGIGVSVVPFSYDTQYRPCTPWHYSAAGQAGAASFGMYFWGLTSTLSAPPGAYVMDSHTIAGKPTVIYETNASRPSAYRAERPFINLALAGWQDWDAMFWHYYHSTDWPDEQFLTTDMPYMSSGFYWTAVEIERDPAMLSAIALAGQAFIGGHLQPAPNPVTYRIGRKAIFGYDFWNGLSIGRAAFQSGAAIAYDPDGDYAVRLEGANEEDFTNRITAAVRSGDQIVWDWPNGRLIIDAPGVKAYAGKPPPDQGWYRFRDGIAVGRFGNDFVAFAAVSADGKPLTGANASQRMCVNARRDARNTGFDMDMSAVGPDGAHVDPSEQARRIRSRGTAPIVEDNVPFTLCFPTEVTGRWRGYDFATRQVMDRAVSGTHKLEHDGRPLFMGILDVSARGKSVETPQTTAPAASGAVGAEGGKTTSAGPAVSRNVWHPLPGMTWADSYAAVHRALRESSLVMTALSPEDSSTVPEKTIRLTEAVALFDLPANIEICFADGRMRRVEATFVRPPSLQDVIRAYERRFGAPERKQVADAAFQTSRVVWSVKGTSDQRLAIVLIEAQGTMQIGYELGESNPSP